MSERDFIEVLACAKPRARQRPYLFLKTAIDPRPYAQACSHQVIWSQHLLKDVDPNTTIGLLSNAHVGRCGLMRWPLNALEIPHDPKGDYVEFFQKLQDFIIEGHVAQVAAITVSRAGANPPWQSELLP